MIVSHKLITRKLQNKFAALCGKNIITSLGRRYKVKHFCNLFLLRNNFSTEFFITHPSTIHSRVECYLRFHTLLITYKQHRRKQQSWGLAKNLRRSISSFLLLKESYFVDIHAILCAPSKHSLWSNDFLCTQNITYTSIIHVQVAVENIFSLRIRDYFYFCFTILLYPRGNSMWKISMAWHAIDEWAHFEGKWEIYAETCNFVACFPWTIWTNFAIYKGYRHIYLNYNESLTVCVFKLYRPFGNFKVLIRIRIHLRAVLVITIHSYSWLIHSRISLL